MTVQYARRTGRLVSFAFMVAGGLMLAACGGDVDRTNYPDGMGKGSTIDSKAQEKNSIFGPGGLLGGGTKNAPAGGAIGVNSFLWRASLDTVAFMPLASADPFGGVIITDWYTTAAAPNERFKLNVFILDRTLRADGLKVTVFRQTRADPNAAWADEPAAPEMSSNIEDAILTRARQLRIDAAAGS